MKLHSAETIDSARMSFLVEREGTVGGAGTKLHDKRSMWGVWGGGSEEALFKGVMGKKKRKK